MTGRRVDVLVPQGIHDPQRPSGGNTYDRRLAGELHHTGWAARTVEVDGGWPWSSATGREGLAHALAAVPDASVVLVDGLLASRLPEVVVPASHRLRVVLVVHLPVGVDDDTVTARQAEREVLRAAAAVVVPSAWCRDWLLAAYGLDPACVHVAHPGVDEAVPARGTLHGGSLLCVGTVAPGKGHDVLLAALAEVADLSWRCVSVGPALVAPDYVARLRGSAGDLGLADRFLIVGPRRGAELDAAYDGADVLALASRAETYGMVVTEALAHGLPVIATDVGGVPEALGAATAGMRAGVLVPPGDAAALAAVLRRWLADASLRQSLRAAARRRRADLTPWSTTAGEVARVLREVAA
ncbi:glycosyltransferase family 4 protein [Nocardioides sp. P5_C9_2]